MSRLSFARADTGEVVATNVRPARTLLARMKGLLGVRTLPPGEGIWITPCNSIHMLGMSLAIDAIFLDRELRVVRTYRSVPPGAIIWPVRGAHSVIELGPGTLDTCGPLEGARLVVQEVLT